MSVALVPFLLPKMHDRYFYPADIFSLLAAFYMPEFGFSRSFIKSFPRWHILYFSSMRRLY